MFLIINLPFLKRKVGTENKLLHLAMRMSLATLRRPGGGGQKLDKIKERMKREKVEAESMNSSF